MRDNRETLRRCQLAYDNQTPEFIEERDEEEDNEDEYCPECKRYGCCCDEMYEYHRERGK